jgi:hypothetical protein
VVAISGNLKDGKLDAAEYYYEMASVSVSAGCTAVYAPSCDAVVNDGTAATCESAGHCTYTAATQGRSCGFGPPARFGHAAIKVSLDFMIFGGHTGSM